MSPVLRLRDAALAYGSRTLWSGLDLDVAPGEFVAVLGANGSGKTSLVRAILGLQSLTAGSVEVGVAEPDSPHQGAGRVLGYIPQQRRFEPGTPLRARDVVRQGIDGHRWGFGWPGRVPWDRVDEALAEAEAEAFARMPVGVLSGGEQQRVRVAQALVGDPALLLCDEPLVSLDLHSQRVITELVDRRRREHDTAVLFVTHEINPVLPFVDKVLYLAGGRFTLGSVDEVFDTDVLSALYGTRVEVIRSGGRVLVAGVPDDSTHCDGEPGRPGARWAS